MLLAQHDPREIHGTCVGHGLGSICATPSQTLFYKTIHAWAGRGMDMNGFNLRRALISELQNSTLKLDIG